MSHFGTVSRFPLIARSALREELISKTEVHAEKRRLEMEHPFLQGFVFLRASAPARETLFLPQIRSSNLSVREYLRKKEKGPVPSWNEAF